MRRLLLPIALASALAASACVPATPVHPPTPPVMPGGPAPAAFDMLITVIAPGPVRKAPDVMTGTFRVDDPKWPTLYPCTRVVYPDGSVRLACHLPKGIPVSVGGPITISSPGNKDFVGRANSATEGCPCDPGHVPEIHLESAGSPWTPAQIADTQGDLMIWAPDVGCAPEANINCAARGLQAGWVWALSIPRYNAAHREQLYQDILKMGYTHVAVQASQPVADEGYHGLYPMSPGDVAAYGPLLNTIATEIHAHHLLLKCAGVAPAGPAGAPGGVVNLPEAPLATGFDGSQCDQVMNDWDNTTFADCRIDYLSRVFPGKPIYFELPSGAVHPDGDSCSTVVPTDDNGGAWIRSVQQRDPNFVGVSYESDYPQGVEANAAYFAKAHLWFRDIQEENTESTTYWQFWDGIGPDTVKSYNDALMARVPWLHGYMSGGTSHPVVIHPTTDGHFTGELDASLTQTVNAPDFRGWAQTATISSVTLGVAGVTINFDKKDGPNRWPDTPDQPGMGPLQYSLGVAINRNGTWYAVAPIEFWYGLEQSGGQIQDRSVPCSQGFLGQLACGWFYDGRWGALEGYQPQEGETIGIFVVAGDARNNFNPTQERSDIALFPMPPQGTVVTLTK